MPSTIKTTTLTPINTAIDIKKILKERPIKAISN